jgi:hypothetical protein
MIVLNKTVSDNSNLSGNAPEISGRKANNVRSKPISALQLWIMNA